MWSEAPLQNRDLDEPLNNPLLDANILDDMPKGDKQNLSETLELTQKQHDHGTGVGVPAHRVETSQEKSRQTRTGLATTTVSRNAD